MAPAWGRLSRRRVRALNALQLRVMALGSHPRIAAAYGSHMLAYLLLSLEQLTTPSGITKL